ncbi:MAG: hypothetical protein AAGH99_11735 [Planctomycetota bacterium]
MNTTTAQADPTAPETRSAYVQPIVDPPWLRRAVWLVLAFFAVVLLVSPAVLSRENWEQFVRRELGVMELSTVVFLAVACFLSARLALRRAKGPTLARLYFGCFALGCFYFAGEEASWGQHVIGFTPPESIAEGNAQREFNIHNIDSPIQYLFNEGPRFVAVSFCFFLGGVIPLWWRHHAREQKITPARAVPWSYWVPGLAVVPCGIFATLATVPRKLLERMGYEHADNWAWLVFGDPSGEFKETLIAMTLLVYVASIFLMQRRRTRAQPAAVPSAD